jgi:hypothetical protein
MNKFEADAKMLEICDYARYAPGFLNRQIVTLLMEKCLGVPDGIFHRLQVCTVICLAYVIVSPLGELKSRRLWRKSVCRCKPTPLSVCQFGVCQRLAKGMVFLRILHIRADLVGNV